jgi:hypothetical protein
MSDLRAEHSSDLPRGRTRNNKKKKSKPLNLGRDTSSHAHGLNARTRLPCFSWMDGWMDPGIGCWEESGWLKLNSAGWWGRGEDGFSLALALFSSFWLLPYAMSKRSSPQISLRALLWPPLAVTHKFETTRHENRDTSNPPPVPDIKGEAAKRSAPADIGQTRPSSTNGRAGRHFQTPPTCH